MFVSRRKGFQQLARSEHQCQGGVNCDRQQIDSRTRACREGRVGQALGGADFLN